MKSLIKYQIAARMLAIICVPWLVVFAANFGVRLASIAFDQPFPPWKLYADTTWVVTRYLASFCLTIWLIGYVISWFSTGGFQKSHSCSKTEQHDS